MVKTTVITGGLSKEIVKEIKYFSWFIVYTRKFLFKIKSKKPTHVTVRSIHENTHSFFFEIILNFFVPDQQF